MQWPRSFSLRRSSQRRFGPCNSHTWGTRHASAPKCYTEDKSRLAWPFFDDGTGDDRCANWNGVAWERPWLKTLKQSYVRLWHCSPGLPGTRAKLRKLWANGRIVKPIRRTMPLEGSLILRLRLPELPRPIQFGLAKVPEVGRLGLLKTLPI